MQQAEGKLRVMGPVLLVFSVVASVYIGSVNNVGSFCFLASAPHPPAGLDVVLLAPHCHDLCLRRHERQCGADQEGRGED
eukprot:759683-Hanusia_phi.AAC.1